MNSSNMAGQGGFPARTAGYGDRRCCLLFVPCGVFDSTGNCGSNILPEEAMTLGLLKKGVKITVENVCQGNQHIDAWIVEPIFDLAVGACGDLHTSELQFGYHIRASQAERCPQFSNVCTNQVVGSLIDSFHNNEFIQNFIKKVSKMDANMIK